MDNYSVTHVVKNDMGGISSLIKNLIEYRGKEALPQEVIFFKVDGNIMTPYVGNFVNDIPVIYFEYSKKNNLYYSFKKLKKLVGNGKGVLISNDCIDLLMLSHYNINKKVIQIVHDTYNIKLSIQFEPLIDEFICHSYFYYEVLLQLIPERRNDIHFISYGIPIIKNETNKREKKCLNLVFIGRHDKMKGVYDLFEINKILQEKNVPVKWLILGKGPETEKIKEQWKDEENATFYTAVSNEEIIQLCMEQDIMVFPTKFEGFPVAMVEAMSAGCVPVVSDLPGGIRELGTKGNAIICELNNNSAFAAAIIKLYNDPILLRQMSCNCMNYISANHNAVLQSPKYQQLFKEIALKNGSPRHHKIKDPLGSRLDKSYIPNFITNFIRSNISN